MNDSAKVTKRVKDILSPKGASILKQKAELFKAIRIDSLTSIDELTHVYMECMEALLGYSERKNTGHQGPEETQKLYEFMTTGWGDSVGDLMLKAVYDGLDWQMNIGPVTFEARRDAFAFGFDCSVLFRTLDREIREGALSAGLSSEEIDRDLRSVANEITVIRNGFPVAVNPEKFAEFMRSLPFEADPKDIEAMISAISNGGRIIPLPDDNAFGGCGLPKPRFRLNTPNHRRKFFKAIKKVFRGKAGHIKECRPELMSIMEETQFPGVGLSDCSFDAVLQACEDFVVSYDENNVGLFVDGKLSEQRIFEEMMGEREVSDLLGHPLRDAVSWQMGIPVAMKTERGTSFYFGFAWEKYRQLLDEFLKKSALDLGHKEDAIRKEFDQMTDEATLLAEEAIPPLGEKNLAKFLRRVDPAFLINTGICPGIHSLLSTLPSD